MARGVKNPVQGSETALLARTDSRGWALSVVLNLISTQGEFAKPNWQKYPISEHIN